MLLTVDDDGELLTAVDGGELSIGEAMDGGWLSEEHATWRHAESTNRTNNRQWREKLSTSASQTLVDYIVLNKFHAS